MRHCSVRAVIGLMGYEKDRSEIPFWEDVLTNKDVAAYAFNALVDIDPFLPDIPQYLRTLWQKQLLEDWPVDTAFLMRRAAREQGGMELIESVLKSLRAPEMMDRLKKELARRAWSAEWLPILGRASGESVAEGALHVKRSA